MIDLAESAPKDPAARDALIWVIDKPGMRDQGAYGVEFARAAALLVRYHGDDPEAVRLGLGLDNLASRNRDALLFGFYAAAKGREARGLAQMALAQYLVLKGTLVYNARENVGRERHRFPVWDDVKRTDNKVDQSDEDYAYDLELRLCDPDATRAEARRLHDEVIAEYGDVPYRSTTARKMEALLREPEPKWNGVPLTADDRRKIEAKFIRVPTLAQAAEGRLDEMDNLAVGKPAPEIDGLDVLGKPLKLSDFRGKVVVLVFWGSWCGPCMIEVPHERKLAERLKDKPFALLGVNCNEPKDAAIQAMQAERITWPNWLDGDAGPIVGRYHVRSYPSVFVLDAAGVVRSRGARGPDLDKIVDDLLKGPAGDVTTVPKPG